jgi:aspartyl protease family protein
MGIIASWPARVLVALAAALPAALPAAPEIRVVGLFRDRAVVMIDGRQRVLKAGETSPEGVALVSATSHEAVIEVGGRRETLTLGTHIGSTYEDVAPGTTVTIAPDDDGMYRVAGSINGFQVDFLVDTGASFISMNRHQASRLGLDYRLRGQQSQALTASGTTTVWLMELDRVRVGDIELSRVPGAVHDGDYPVEILLGNSFLGRVDMQREGRLLQLRSR